jgi:hypothetical protein
MFDKLPNGTPIVFANTKPFKKAKRRDKTLFKIETTKAGGTIQSKCEDPLLTGKIIIRLRTYSELRFISGTHRGSWAFDAYHPKESKDKDPCIYCGTKTIQSKDDWDAYEDIMYIVRNIYPKLCEYGECHY